MEKFHKFPLPSQTPLFLVLTSKHALKDEGTMNENNNRNSIITAGGVLGIGLGGFIDGIVLHQVLQWHHMVTGERSVSTVAGLEVNTMADGFFHLATWLVVLGASMVTVALWRRGRLAPSWTFHIGGLLAGWGLFNVVEGLVDHQILRVHHVRDDLGGPLSWDLAFLAF